MSGNSKKHLGPTGTHWLKTAHITVAALWLGGAFSLVLLQWDTGAAGDGELYGHDLAKKFVDDFVVIPAAVATLLTGLVYALKTPWGFFRHRWVTVKWIITVGGLLIGTFFLGPWVNGQPPLSATLGLGALDNPDYLYMKTMNGWIGGLQVTALIVAMGLSVFKPWKKKAS